MNFPYNKVKNHDLALRIANAIIEKKPKTFEEAEKIKNQICGESRSSTISNMDIIRVAPEMSDELKKLLQKRKIRTESGVAVITILTKPFSCPGQCVFCPQEKAGENGETLFEQDAKNKADAQNIPEAYRTPDADVMPKSYFSNEPAASRALLSNFDPFNQVKSRLKSLGYGGHDTSKIELIILGGTFSYLPDDYREWFTIRALQALNGDQYEDETTLEEAQKKNEDSENRCIALVIETRPDFINEKELIFLRKLGCTKVELGVQSTDDEVLKLCKRGHLKSHAVKAISLLRNAGFKLGFHIMPGLPGSTIEKDKEIFEEIFEGEDFKPDFLKIYPCTITPFSELSEWYKQGKYTPLTEEDLFPLLLDIKRKCPPWVRISRLVRDIPATSIEGGSKTTNLRQYILDYLKKNNEKCRCIRCREIKSKTFDESEIILKIDQFKASGGTEYFISYETQNDQLLAMLRLRVNMPNVSFPELQDSGIIRELHTYGAVVPVGQKENKKAQHIGLGTKLIEEAEKITKSHNINKLAVISGIGVKNFWRKREYLDQKYYLIKSLGQ
ncbi:MAG: tRNA uridine(34) 5-carboxymethylaminomethyl modification radical SAM/GNAT enzyme Elp3 [Candidatus Gracilibacteria bacterium]|jgi:elongator complex protein 3|nr:tRNA uridine(34) 5-carboxymethylaminomethyl modification radical SAM/GNAT enzyme Elp3 [Candidatus Gracilibacteria bacterium]